MQLEAQEKEVGQVVLVPQEELVALAVLVPQEVQETQDLLAALVQQVSEVEVTYISLS